MSQLADLLPPDARVLILQPGDMLVISNCGDIPSSAFQELVERFPFLRNHVAIFEDDVNLDLLSDLIARKAAE